MATARFDANRANGRLRKEVNKIVNNNKFFEEASKIAIDRIKLEARRGKPLNNSRNFPQLKDSTVKNRARRAKFNKTQKPFRPGLSNLNFSGQLQNALITIKDKRGFSVQVGDSRRQRLKTSKNKREKNPPTNQELDFDLRDRGFFLFTAKGIKSEGSIAKRIRQLTLRFLRRALRSRQ